MATASDPAVLAVESFLKTFGEPAQVREEIKAYWSHANALPFPLGVFNHLVENRIASGEVSAKRGQFLKDYFAESFSPEPVTGFLPKHREPLARGLAEWYVEQHPERPVHGPRGEILLRGRVGRGLETAGAQDPRQTSS